jgi:hypothetical protein
MKYRPYILLAAALLLSGCDGDWNETWNAGTSKGLALCLSKGEKQNLSTETVRRHCLAKHQRPVKETLDGHARYVGGTFQGSLTNIGNDVIVTEYTVILKHAKSDKIDTAVFSQRLLEPQRGDTFEISKLSFFPMEDSELNKERFSWQTKDVKGVKIAF